MEDQGGRSRRLEKRSLYLVWTCGASPLALARLAQNTGDERWEPHWRLTWPPSAGPIHLFDPHSYLRKGQHAPRAADRTGVVMGQENPRMLSEPEKQTLAELDSLDEEARLKMFEQLHTEHAHDYHIYAHR
jgi:hypothetical protein